MLYEFNSNIQEVFLSFSALINTLNIDSNIVCFFFIYFIAVLIILLRNINSMTFCLWVKTQYTHSYAGAFLKTVWEHADSKFMATFH